ncbi:hypothetical protein CW745_06720 [Psychromonas sp. psych-6C06]|uniref:CBS domain-containing protein n=1 Tax=Psychromonas sp. psych-6C06 TaxID=2058089 RepID=UPI000C345FC4|nr:CBS domain-containing protein [Psychromonas sp. psych-6C06]PKF63107.1 hypothetical protein CW745_06720 [Psychromonas sp. psych-6C06]
MTQLNIDSIIHKQPINVQCQTPLTKIIDTLIQSQQAQVPVVNADNKLLGMVSLVDCQKALLVGAYHCDKPVRVNDIMAKQFTALTEDESLSEVAIKTQASPEDIFPVLKGEKLVGILKRVDLLVHLHNNLAQCSHSN